MLDRKLEPKSPISANKDEDSSREEDFIFEKVNAPTKNLRPVSAKGAEFFKQKRPVTSKHPPINLRRERNKRLVDYSILTRLKPRRVNIDKERLYEENMALKLKNNALLEELIRLRTKVSQIEKELSKREDQSDHLQNLKPVHLVNSLKNKIKDLKGEIQLKNDEVFKLKKNIKSTKINEIELEVQAYIDECTRLRHHLEEIMRQRDTPQLSQGFAEDKNQQNSFLLNNLKKENEDLNQAVVQGNNEITKLKEKVQELEKAKKKSSVKKSELSALKSEIQKLKTQVDHGNKEIAENESNFKEEVARIRKNLNEALNKNTSYENKIKELTGQNEEQAKQIKVLEDARKSPNKLEEKGIEADKSKKVEDREIRENERKRNEEEAKARENERKRNEEAQKLKELEKKKNDDEQKLKDFERKKAEDEARNKEIARKKAEEEAKNKENERKIAEEQKAKDEERKKIEEERQKEEKDKRIEDENKKKEADDKKLKESEKQNVEESKKPKDSEKRKTDEDSAKIKSDKKKPEEDPKPEKRSSHDADSESKDPVPDKKSKKDPKKSSKKSKEKSKSPAKHDALSTPELKSIFDHFSFRMQINRIPKSKLFSTLFGNLAQEKPLSRTEMSSYLKKPPFSFSPSDIEALSTFLLDSPKSTAKSIEEKLSKFTEDWEVFTPQDEESFDEQIGSMIGKCKTPLMDACKEHDKSNSGIISLDEFKKSLKKVGAELPARVFRYMMLLFYSHDMKLAEVPYRHFIKAYGEPANEEDEEGDITDEEKAKVVRHYLGIMAQILIQNKRAVIDVFECDENGIISPDEFFMGLKRMGLGEMEQEHVMLMLEALQFEEASEVCVHIEELEEILMHYGVAPAKDQEEADAGSEKSAGHYKKVSLLDSENYELSDDSPDKAPHHKASSKGISENSPFGKNKSLGERASSNEPEEYGSDYDDDFQ